MSTQDSVERRLATLSTMEDGWWHGQGAAPDATCIDHVRLVILKLCDDAGLARPGLYPVEEGGIFAEWEAGDVSADARAWSLSVEWHNDGRVIMHALCVNTYGEVGADFNWMVDGYQSALVSELRRLMEVCDD